MYSKANQENLDSILPICIVARSGTYVVDKKGKQLT
jgi:hypothetical protein